MSATEPDLIQRNTGQPSLSVIEVDFLKAETLQDIPVDIDAAYYLIHSMSTSTGDFEKMEEMSANNFKERLQQTKVTPGDISERDCE